MQKPATESRLRAARSAGASGAIWSESERHRRARVIGLPAFFVV